MSKVRNSFAVMLMFAVMFGLAQDVQAQQQSTTDMNTYYMYNMEKKSEAVAVLGELAFPLLGHLYAGDPERGLIPAAVSLGGIAVMMAGGADLNAGMMTLGMLGYLGGRGWGVYSAYQTADDHNLSLRQRLNITVGMNLERQPELGFRLAL